MPTNQEQRRVALVIANDVRIRRAQLKAELGAGRASPDDVLLDPPPCARRMRALEFLEALPKIGPVRAYKLLQRASVSPSRHLEGLTPRERQRVLRGLRGLW